ncbi:MAG: hypothetical protein R3302_01685 [Sulfurimonadaceae bacterium]|nr:hypothetical protein [Sulfurimonadaceae bacterium]
MRFDDHNLDFSGRPPAPTPSTLKDEEEHCSVWQNPVAPLPETVEPESSERAPVPERSGVVLLMTLFFIIAITLVVGVSLTQMQKANAELGENRFLAQSAMSVEDVLAMMPHTERFGTISDAASLNLFLSMLPIVPLETGKLSGTLSFESARGKININTLGNSNKAFKTYLEYYLIERYNVQDAAYLTHLFLDAMGGYKEEGYHTDLFDRIPWMYRDRIADAEHLRQILDFYVQNRRDGSVNLVPWSELVRFDDHNRTSIDANYITPELWAMLQPQLSDDEIALLTAPPLPYEKSEELPIDQTLRSKLVSDFNIVTFDPTVKVTLKLREGEALQSSISFEYNIQTKQARNFDYVI